MTTPTQQQEIEQARRNLVAKAEAQMGVPRSGGTDISEHASRGLVTLLEDMLTRHPEIAQKHTFSPYVFDDRAAKFTQQALLKEAQAGKMDTKTITAFNLVKYITNYGELDNGGLSADGNIIRGTQTTKPGVAAPWVQQRQDPETYGRFFSPEVYRELNINTVNNIHDYIGHRLTVSYKALFEPDNADPARQKMIKDIARDLQIRPVDPQAKEWRYTQDDVARIATEMLSRQARTLCDVKYDREVTDAIMSGRYMPHMVDMKLAEIGFGRPSEWNNKAVEQSLRDNGTIKGDPLKAPSREADLYRYGEVQGYQSQAWAQRFGAISSKHADDLMVQTSTRSESEAYRRAHQSPYAYFDPILSNLRKASYTAYNNVREHSYMPRQNWMAHNNMSECAATPAISSTPQQPTTSSSGASFVNPNGNNAPAVAGGATFVNPATLKPTTGNADAGCSTTSSFVCPDKSTSGTSGCANAVFVCPDTLKDKLKSNTADATGQLPNADPSCSASGAFICPPRQNAAAAPVC